MRAPVWYWPEGATKAIQVGILERDDATGSGAFEYDTNYVKVGGRALDPGQLRHISARQPILIPASAREGIPGIIADAGPDAWGRQVLAQDLGFTPTALETLVFSADDGAGNIAVGDLASKPPIDSLDLTTLADAIERRQAGLPVKDARLLGLLSPDTALGGAKPKATIFQNGYQWIAKFPERGDPVNLPYYEAAAMRLARRLGINVATVKVEPLPAARSILLVERFDRTIGSDGVRRFGFASALTVLGSAAQTIGSARSYLQLVKKMRPWLQGQFDHSKRELWNRIVFNALVGNGDDHPRNHGFLQKDSQWHLSPAFDIVPTWIPRDRLSLAMPFLQIDKIKQTSLVTAKNLIQAAPEYGIGVEDGRERMLTMAQRAAGELASVLREIDAPASVGSELEPMLDWVRRIHSEALALSAADCVSGARQQSRHWRWSP